MEGGGGWEWGDGVGRLWECGEEGGGGCTCAVVFGCLPLPSPRFFGAIVYADNTAHYAQDKPA